MIMSRPRLLLALASLSLVQPAFATAYKWVDKDGETHYSQSPPTAVKTEVIKAPAGPASTPATPKAATAPSAKSPASESAAKPTPDAKAKAEDSAVRAENCASARKNLEVLKNAPRVTIKDQNGLYHRLNDDERKARSTEAQKRIDEFCAP
ncbi:MAG: DUF4124 domain-containing protein [Gammaproteobacteria bacterium]